VPFTSTWRPLKLEGLPTICAIVAGEAAAGSAVNRANAAAGTVRREYDAVGLLWKRLAQGVPIVQSPAYEDLTAWLGRYSLLKTAPWGIAPPLHPSGQLRVKSIEAGASVTEARP
jgi:hypothetical protein